MGAPLFDLRGRRALVTGASSGIGLELARTLAAHGCHLVLAARRHDRLKELGALLGASHGVEVDPIAVDLSAEGGARALIDEVDARHATVDVLVNNAGVGMYGHGLRHDWDAEGAMLRLNVLALAELTKHYARKMEARASGRILQVASVAGFLPCPGYSAYAATKAFVLHHAEGLAEELRESGVRVTVVCPGTTNTEFFDVAGHERSKIQRSTALEPADVALRAVEAMRRGRRTVVTGLANRAAMAALQLAPRRAHATIARWILD
ncbi:MAG: SDR family oxidoreductase [Planctomycetota bacterium]